NRAPELDELPTQLSGQEGQPLALTVFASDPDGDALLFWADHLPPGAIFDPAQRTFSWTPGFQAAGTYQDVRLVVSDGVNQVSGSVRLVIAPGNQAPPLAPIADQTVREGDPLRFRLLADDADGDARTYSSPFLPGGARLEAASGLFTWTPAFY